MLLTMLGICAAIFGGSGALRRSVAKDRVEKAERDYQNIHNGLRSAAELREHILQELASLARVAVKCNLRAQRMLLPLAKSAGLETCFGESQNGDPHHLAIRNTNTFSTEFHAATGVATGAAVAGTLWFGAQAIGIASTGMPIVFLHGAALHNAALAALGGGALKAGGFGMVGGSVVLASAVALPAAAVFGWENTQGGQSIERGRR